MRESPRSQLISCSADRSLQLGAPADDVELAPVREEKDSPTGDHQRGPSDFELQRDATA